MKWDVILEHVAEKDRQRTRELIEERYLDLFRGDFAGDHQVEWSIGEVEWSIGELGTLDTLRFQLRPMYRWLADNISLNDFWVAADRMRFALADMAAFYRGMGYTLCGFGEIFSDALAQSEARLANKVEV